ncbi:MAG TPA: MobF family relaxase [Gaiellaceae bacterium]|nr:MobF family relaxase [Gaiellaceae bacterium]
MLAISKLTPGQEGYYERSVAPALDDYYAGRGESPGVWSGRGAELLGLEGVVEDGELGKLVRGLHPKSEERLRRHVKQRIITVERIDPETGERRTEQKKLNPVAGFDLVFSAPKSVSLLYALGGEEAQLAVARAHAAAWRAALGYLEDEACVTRRGRNGIVREHANGFVAAAYQHRTNRAQEPHLHTHVIVANMARSPDETWRALDGEALLKHHRLAAGYLYQAHLRHALARSLGVRWRDPAKGMAELRGLPQAVLREFSTRRAQVLDYLTDRGTAGFYAAKVAQVETRERKKELDLPRLREDWRARAAEHGLGRRELDALVHRGPAREPTGRELLDVAAHMLGPAGLTERRTTFSAAELVMAWAQAHPQGADASRIRRLSARFVRMEGVEPVGEQPSPGRPARYSTAELLRMEREALALVTDGFAMGAPTAEPELVERTLAGGEVTLSTEQREMVRAVATSGDLVVAVVGRAGAGKTTAMHAVANVFRVAGKPVLGAAPSGVAAEKLQDETGIPSTTLHRLLDGGRGADLPTGVILVVDEAGMAETRVLAPILQRVADAAGKAILVGDPQQLPAVGAGGLFAGIVERYGAVEMTENRRQRDALEHDALDAIRRGLGRDYLAFVQRRERLVVSENPLATRTRLLADWWRSARDDLPGNVMIALRRRDVAELNALARALMDSHGRLGADRLTVAGREFAKGDRVVCLRNSDRTRVKNGTRGTVEKIDRERGELVVATDRGDRVTLARRYLEAGNVRHGYALTGHSGQGVTVERAFVLGKGEARLQEWGYVALSRARDATRLYITGTPPERESQFHDVDDRDPVARMAQALEESAVERLAVDQRPLPTGPKHKTRAEIRRQEPDEGARTRRRLIEQQRLVAQKSRESAERRLSEASQSLDRLPRLFRGRRRDQLRAEIARERSAVGLAEEKLAQLDRECPEGKRRSALHTHEGTAGRSRIPSLHRSDDVGLGL